jgi:hypothetical protein
MARAQWVALESPNAIPDEELRMLLGESYWLVWERLPKQRRKALSGESSEPVHAASSATKSRKTAASKRTTEKKRS